MDNYYEILGLDKNLDTSQIRLTLARENKKYRDRTNLDNPEVVRDATEKLRHIQQAMVHFKSDEDRQEYDLELEESASMGGFVNYYSALSIPSNATKADIEKRIAEIEDDLRHRPSGRATIRDRRLLREARHILLDEEERRQFDEDLKAVEIAQRPIPLVVRENELYDVASIEVYFDKHPREAVELLIDGDIEAWLRWSLGNSADADAIRDIARYAHKQNTPYFALDGLIRAINPDRPLSLYQLHIIHGVDTIPRIETPHQLIQWADKYPQVIATGLGVILPWLKQQDTNIYRRFEEAQSNDKFGGDVLVTLERLLAAIDPSLSAPKITISGTQSNWRIDFGRFSKSVGGTGSRTIKMTKNGRGYIYGTARSNVNWLEISPARFAGNSCSFKVTPIYGEIFPLQVGHYSARITVNLVDNRVKPVEIDVRIEIRRF